MEDFFTDAAGVWMLFPGGWWKLLGSDPDDHGSLGEAGTGRSSCVSLWMLLEAFPVLCARAVRPWNLVHYFHVRVSGSHCFGHLGVAHDCENWIFREMTFFVVAMHGTKVDTCSASVLWRLWMIFTHLLRCDGLGS